MDDKSVIDLKAFVPAKDPAIARQFYSDLGFKQNWANDEIAEFQIGAFRFLLQELLCKGARRQFHDESAGRGRRPLVETHKRHQSA